MGGTGRGGARGEHMGQAERGTPGVTHNCLAHLDF